MTDINEKTAVRLSVTKFVSVLVLVAGLVPYIQYQARAIVREEMAAQGPRQQEWEKRWDRWETEQARDRERWAQTRERLAQILTELKYLRPLVGR